MNSFVWLVWLSSATEACAACLIRRHSPFYRFHVGAGAHHSRPASRPAQVLSRAWVASLIFVALAGVSPGRLYRRPSRRLCHPCHRRGHSLRGRAHRQSRRRESSRLASGVYASLRMSCTWSQTSCMSAFVILLPFPPFAMFVILLSSGLAIVIP